MFSFSLKHEMQFTAKKLSLFEIRKLRNKRKRKAKKENAGSNQCNELDAAWL
jgi:hypothetical protein